jgi:hypothetical protein
LWSALEFVEKRIGKKICCPKKKVEWGQELTKTLYETSPNFPHRAAGQNKLL